MKVPGATDNLKKCTYCSKYIRQELTLCEYCGYNFETGALDPNFKASSIGGVRRKGGFSGRLKAVFAALLFIAAFVVLYNGIWGKSDFFNSLFSNIIERIQDLTSKKDKPGPVSGKKDKSFLTLSQVTLPDKEDIERRKRFLVLEGIVYASGGRSFVTINGEVLTEGDTITSVVIGRIKETSVELVLPNGESKTLELSQSIPIPAQR